MNDLYGLFVLGVLRLMAVVVGLHGVLIKLLRALAGLVLVEVEHVLKPETKAIKLWSYMMQRFSKKVRIFTAKV
jgi:hypothetical protein